MKGYLGDFVVGQTIRIPFNTKDANTREPITLAGSPVVSVYRDGGTTQFTSGATLTVDFDGVTGLHYAVIDTSSSATNYVAGSDYVVYLSAGTVDGISVVGEILGVFSLQRVQTGVLSQGVLVAGTTSSVTLAGNTAAGVIAGQAVILILSGSAAGEIKTLDTVNAGTGVCVPGPTNFTNAPGTARYIVFAVPEASSDNAALVTQLNAIEADTQDIQSRIPTALVGGAINANVSAFQANAITATAIASGAITSAKFAAGAVDATAIGTGAITNTKFAAGAIDAAAIADNAIDAGAIASGAITSAKIATDAITSTGLAATATAEIAAAVLSAATATPIAANIEQVNAITIIGAGTSGSPWGPA